MLKNYFLVAIRNFWRNRTFSLINILGLSIGISASLVIFLIVSYDFSFDHFEPDQDRIYHVVSDFSFTGETIHTTGVTYPLPSTLGKETAGIQSIATFRTADEITKVAIPDPNIKSPAIFRNQNDIAYTDTAYCALLGYTWLAGSAKTALSQPYQVVLTETSAKKYFPNLPYNQLIGRNILFADSITTTVTGVIKDIPEHTDFKNNTLISYATLLTKRLQPSDFNDWTSTNSASQLFIKLAPGVTPQNISNQLKTIYAKYNKPRPGSTDTGEYLLQSLSDLHFSEHGIFDNTDRSANRKALYGLMALAIFLLLLACINFINLTTAQAAQRAREIGIRKTMGSHRIQLALQFLNETFLLTLIATILSIILAPLLLTAFADFIPKGIQFDLRQQPGILGFLLALIVVVSLLSGAYPALVLSAFKPITVLKSQWSAGAAKTRGAWLRKTLTVSQFVIAQVFIIATLLVARQIDYVLNTEMGFKKDAIITFATPYTRGASQRRVLLQKLEAIPGIATISNSSAPPSSGSTNTTDTKYKDGKKEIKTQLQCLYGDSNYIPLYHINLLAGSNITQCDTTNQVVINETYARQIGFTDPRKAVGATILWNDHPLPVVGVVADFHQASLHTPIKPLGILNGLGIAFNFNIALPKQNPQGTAWKQTIATIQNAYKTIYPDEDFNYTFFDESIAKFYEQEQNTARLLTWATGLAIFISCLGLMGLVIYITNQRTKEIGIRKVIGASIAQLILLLSKDFLKLIGVAILISIPIAWWGSHKWLESFAYRADLSWWIFAAGAAILFLIALIILCIRTFKAANANPVNSLRSE